MVTDNFFIFNQGDVSDIADDVLPNQQQAQNLQDSSNKRKLSQDFDEIKSSQCVKKPAPVPKPSSFTPTPEIQQPSSETPTVSVIPSSNEQGIAFKMEPYESNETQAVGIADESQLESFAEEAIEEGQGDDTEDYSLLEGDEEPQAGTSSYVLGDNQGR